MFNNQTNRMPQPLPDQTPPSEGGLRAPAHFGPLRKLWWWFDFIILVKLARLRFIAILLAIGAVIIYWDTIHAYYEKWTRPLAGEAQAASADTEFWCPMHPTIVRDQPDKCPICGMPLAKRKKGSATAQEAQPAGVVRRVQLTPYRQTLAGVQTVELAYQPLSKQITTVGFVEFDERKLAHIAAPVKGRIERLYANVTGEIVKKGDPLALLNIRFDPELAATVEELRNARRRNDGELERMARKKFQRWNLGDELIEEMLRTDKADIRLTIPSPINGHVIRKYQVEGKYVEEATPLYDVADLSTVWIQAQVYEDERAFLAEGLPVEARLNAYPNQPFPGEVAFVFPHLDRASRTLTVRFDVKNPKHQLLPGDYATVTIDIPAARLGPGFIAQDGRVLALPERAVIDTGMRKFVYREYLPGVYDGVEVALGPRLVGPDKALFYPVVRGLKPGERVVTTGSFLIDAETRLTSGAASTYFGASGGTSEEKRSAIQATQAAVTDEEAMVRAALAKLSTPDRKLAEAQGFCPILQENLLGSMGVPVKFLIKGQAVFLCCPACKEKALANPSQTLATVAKLKDKAGKADDRKQPSTTQPAPTSEQQAEIKAALAKLSVEDRRLAEAQAFCAVLQNNQLGSMGKPIKVMVKGEPVFLCCEGCEEKALANPDQTLGRVKELKAGTKATSPKD